jgi:hypothetical protein
MSHTLIEILPSQSSSPNNAIQWTPGSKTGTGILIVHVLRASTTYRVTEFGTAWNGRAFHLIKDGSGTDPESDSYDVYCGRNGQDHQCSCKGFAYGRGKPCKHVLAVQALIENGWTERTQEELSNPFQDVSSTDLPF